MIKNVFDKLVTINNDKNKSFEMIINYMAYKLGIKDAVFSCSSQERVILDEIDFKALSTSKPYKDWLGELYEAELGGRVVPYHVANSYCVEFGVSNNEFPKSACINNANTGRVLMSLARLNINVIPFAVESDIELYKICLVNMKLYHVNAVVMFNEVPLDKVSPCLFSNVAKHNIWINTF